MQNKNCLPLLCAENLPLRLPSPQCQSEEEITKAAYWFAKNGNQVDLQHCFEKCSGAAVVESYVAKCDMEIEG